MGSRTSALRSHHMGPLHRTACLSLGFASYDHQVAAFNGSHSSFPGVLRPGGNAGATLSQLEVLLHPGWTLYEREIDLCGFKPLGCRLRLFPGQPYLFQLITLGCPVPSSGSRECPSRGRSVLTGPSQASLTPSQCPHPVRRLQAQLGRPSSPFALVEGHYSVTTERAVPFFPKYRLLSVSSAAGHLVIVFV